MKIKHLIKVFSVMFILTLGYLLIHAATFEGDYIKEIKENKNIIQGTYVDENKYTGLVVSINIRKDNEPFVYINWGNLQINEYSEYIEIISSQEVKFNTPHFQNYTAKLDNDILVLSDGKEEYQLLKQYNYTIGFESK